MSNAKSYKRETISEHWDAIVIGSGIGGLTTAALLAKWAKLRVLVLERHTVLGGFTHVFKRPGYEWDVGVHYIGQTGTPQAPMRRVFDYLTEGRLEWAPLPDIYDSIRIGPRVYDLPSGQERFRARLKEYFPSEAAAIDNYLSAVLSAARWSNLYMAEKTIPRAASRLLGGLMRRPFLRWARQTTAEVLDNLTDNLELKAVLTGQWGDYGLPPRQSSFAAHAIVVAHYLEGASFPVGGAARIAQSIEPTITERGGLLLVAAEVESILLEQGRAAGVKMADGRMLRAPLVVSNAGAYNTFAQLLPADHPASPPMLEAVNSIPQSMAHLCLYGGFQADSGDFVADGTNLWVYGGPDHDQRLRAFLDDPMTNDFPVLFISFPSAKDPDFARRYPGKATVEVVAPVPYSLFQAWEDSRWKKRGPEYEALKASLQSRLLAALEQQVPQLKDRLSYVELSTPLSTAHFTGHPRGQIYGVAQTPTRFTSDGFGPTTDIPGLYLSGADACASGVGGALVGGALAAGAMVSRLWFQKVIQGLRSFGRSQS